MSAHRKLLSVATPICLSNLKIMLDALDTNVPDTCIVRHMNGQLIIEEPHPTIVVEGA